MSLEGFFGSEDADTPMSAERVREYKKRMARNKKHMAAARKQEQKQKKKEDNLAIILLRFIQTSTRTDITLLVARCLEQNIPATLVLSIILLGNEAIQKEVGIHLELDQGMDSDQTPHKARLELKSGEPTPQSDSGDSLDEETLKEAPATINELQGQETRGALVALGENHALPLKMRLAIDLWSRSMWDAISPIPERILKTAVEFNEDPSASPKPKPVVTQLAGFILRDYFTQNQFEQAYDNVKQFADFLVTGLMKRAKDQLDNQMQLSGKGEDTTE